MERRQCGILSWLWTTIWQLLMVSLLLIDAQQSHQHRQREASLPLKHQRLEDSPSLLVAVFHNDSNSDPASSCSPLTKICSSAELIEFTHHHIQNSEFLKKRLEILTENSQRVRDRERDGIHSDSEYEEIYLRRRKAMITSTSNNEWLRYPVVFSAIADERYLHSIDVFIESLLGLGYSLSDILLICASFTCSHDLTQKKIPHMLFRNSQCEPDGSDAVESFDQAGNAKHGHVNIRCAISDAKLAAVASLLKSGISIFLFDLDVYFKRDPLSFMLYPDIVLNAQENELQNTPDELNFGMFLIRPSNETAQMFAEMTRTFRENAKWDQQLFNDFAVSMEIPTYILPRRPFFTFGTDYSKYSASDMEVVHMVCVEGAENKLLLARELFGPFHTPKYYRQHSRTLTWAYDYRSHGETQLIIGMLTSIAQATKRALRVTNWPRYRERVSLFDADTLLREDRVLMVEEKYWDHAHQMFPELVTNFTTLQFNVSNYEDMQKLLNADAESLLRDANDLVVKFLEVYNIDPFPWPNEEKYVCYYVNHARNWCLTTCQGKHF